MGVQAADSERYCLRRKGGRSLIEHPPLFSPDGQSLLVICGSCVRVYNVKTAECARVLEPEQEPDALVAAGFPADDPHNLYGCSATGVITVWTWQRASAILREMKLQINTEDAEINAEVLTFDLLESNECFVTTHAKGTEMKPVLAKYCLQTGELLCEYNTKIKYSKIWHVAIGWNSDDRFAAICDGSEYLHICDLSKPDVMCKSHLNHNQIRIVCVAAHPTENCVVTGDALGRSMVWKGDLFGSKLAREILHWHSLPVITSAFSLQGGYLLTGGMEGVVVRWHLGALAEAAQQRDFLPRLPGCVRHLAVCAHHLAIATTTNSIIITTPQLGVVSTIMECGGLASTTRALGPDLVYHRPLGALLLGGRTGHLQVFSTATDKLLYNVDITGLNKIPSTRTNPCPADTEVTCAAVSADGRWLVTSEYRADRTNYPEERLKFWAFTPNASSPFALNTCVALSHGGCNVISIAINNTSDFCVSAGTDQKFRVWKREEKIQNNKKKESWSCLTACYYASGAGASLDHTILKNIAVDKNEDASSPAYLTKCEDNDIISNVLGVSEPSERNNNDVGSIRTKEAIEADLEMGGVAISQDGSLIAAWFGSKLTLWDSLSCSLRSTLSHPSLRPKGVDVCFGNDDAAHYVVCTTEHCVAVWSLLSLSVRWLVHARPVALAADPTSNRMAVVTDSNDVFVFTPHGSTPLLSRRGVLEPRAGVLRHCAFAPSGAPHTFRLYLMRNDSEIYSLEPEGAAAAQPEGVSHVSLPVSNFGALVAAQQTSGVRREEAISLKTPTAGTHLSQFSAASYMVPSVSLLCSTFLQQLSGATDLDADADRNPEDVQTISDESSADEEEPHDVDRARAGVAKKVEFWKPNYNMKGKRLKKVLTEPTLSNNLAKMLLE